MTRTRPLRFTIVLGVALTATFSLTRDVLAQAWVPAKGEGAVAVAFQNMNVKDHILTTTRVDVGHIDTFVMIADVTYGLTDRIAVDLAIPFVASQYTGNRPHPTALDDGTFHYTFSDFRFALRYNLTRGGAVMTAYIGSVVPSHGYEFFAHSAPGERLHELQVGAYAAKVFERGVPGLFISGRYAYGFTEQVLDISHNRSLADVEVGYFITPAIRAFVIGNGQYTHGGIDLPPVGGLAALPVAYRGVHDQIDRAHHLNLGAGAAYSLTDSVDLFGSFMRTVTGRNEHALNRAFTVGASWSFARKRSGRDAISASAAGTLTAKREGSLARCICQKSGS
jgi:hypothetical protein